MLEQILVKFEDVEDVVSLGSTCVRLGGILSNCRMWRRILAKTELVQHGQVMEDRMKNLADFLGLLANSEAIISLLRKTIYERYPGTVRDRVTVLITTDPQHHSVTLLGLQLLVLADRDKPGHTVLKVKLDACVTRNQLLVLASLHKKIRELVVTMVFCYPEEDGTALCSMLERCSTWRLNCLYLRGELYSRSCTELNLAFLFAIVSFLIKSVLKINF